MTKPFEIEANIAKHKEKLNKLLSGDAYLFSSERKQITEDAGVYIIYDKTEGKVLYVGESDNLRRRLFTDHKSGNRRGSAFRRAISKWKDIDNETVIRQCIVQNFSFRVLPISDKLERKRLEHFAIAVLAPTLNDVVKLGIV